MKTSVKVRIGQQYGGYKSGTILDMFIWKYNELKKLGFKVNLVGISEPEPILKDEEE